MAVPLSFALGVIGERDREIFKKIGHQGLQHRVLRIGWVRELVPMALIINLINRFREIDCFYRCDQDFYLLQRRNSLNCNDFT
jgi:hypothetical protein